MYEETRTQKGKGRPGKNTQYKRLIKKVYALQWTRNTTRLRAEARTNGVFPLLCTDAELSSKEVLQAYKYQPRLEKRFQQFKHVHHGAPLLFKRIDRIEATMFAAAASWMASFVLSLRILSLPFSSVRASSVFSRRFWRE